MSMITRGLGAAVLSALSLSVACGSDHPSGPGGQQTGSACAVAADCYPGVKDKTQILGEVQCLTKVTGGYCTHLCTQDSDCCAAAGECSAGHPEVCAPFENQPQQYCFLSCEQADVSAAGMSDSTAYCQKYANATFTCRSTGGGANNRKICSP
jgi:hypothetical protein